VRTCLALVVVAACAHAPVRPPPDLVAQATAGVTDPVLRDLLARDWDANLREAPLFATSVGDHRFDDRLGDISPDALARGRARRRAVLAEARALTAATLSPEDRTTLELFAETLEVSLEVDDACALRTWSVSAQAANPLVEWNDLPGIHVVRDQADADRLLARFRQLSTVIDDTVANLRLGAAAGRYASAGAVDRVIAMVDGELARPAREWSWVRAAVHPHPGWSREREEAFAAALAGAIDGEVRPALARYRRLLAEEIRPHARAAEGLGTLPGGARCYLALIRLHTTLARTPAELHRLGEEEIARIDGELTALGRRLFGTTDLGATLARVRGDRGMFFASSDEVEARAARALATAKAKIPQFFGILPKADCIVERVPDFEAPYTTIAYYRQPNADGTTPGRYMINVSEPTTRPRYEAAVLAYHESIPGHHLQIATAQELVALPAFRRHEGFTAYVEGWALYAETLADEMGLYEADVDELGRLSYQAWRASRLVVDTGIHAMGWSREQAVAYMLAHTALAENNIKNEVDRYIGNPGQALAYKVGELTILRLRAEARAALGPRFALPAFHDVVLGGGPVSLGVLERRVHDWMAGR
jgi:uncharacterized protein (DUF885 family)